MVDAFLGNAPRDSWIFLGDSTIQRLVWRIRRLDGDCYILKKCKGMCSLAEYMGVSMRDDKTPSDPVSHHAYVCKDWKKQLMGCANRIDMCSHKTIEFWANALAKDVIIPGTNTSHFEVLSKYLSLHHRDVCVVGSGMHDLKDRRLKSWKFVLSVEHYLSVLLKHCGKVIWLSLNASLDEKGYGQRNSRIEDFNEAVKNKIAAEMPQVVYIENYNMSLPKYNMHDDNVHMNATYYNVLARYLGFES